MKQTVQSTTAKDDQSRAMISELTAVGVACYVTGIMLLGISETYCSVFLVLQQQLFSVIVTHAVLLYDLDIVTLTSTSMQYYY